MYAVTLKKAFKKRIRKTYIPYFKRDNNSSNLRSIKKDKDDGNDGSSFIFVTNSGNSGFYYLAFLIFQPPTPGIMATSFDQGSL